MKKLLIIWIKEQAALLNTMMTMFKRKHKFEMKTRITMMLGLLLALCLWGVLNNFRTVVHCTI